MTHRLSIQAQFPSALRATSLLRGSFGAAVALAALGACSSPDAAPPLGQAQQPIVRGQLDREHPQVMLLANQSGFVCSGTLVHVQDRTGFLLTAAHCVTEEEEGAAPLPAEQFVVIAGNDFRASSATFAVDAIHVHPGYDGAFAADDVALAQLDLGDAVPPAVIPPLSPQEDTLVLNDPLLLVGYGQTEQVVDNSVRRRVTRHIDGLDDDLIVYSQQDGRGTCFGDSGGPGLVEVRGEERVASVTSGGVDAGERCSGGFGVGMRVSSYAAFIDSVLSGQSPD
jgi:secreted trypsin-like serine protease